MNIRAEKNWIIQEFQKINDKELILVFKNLLHYADKSKSKVQRMSTEEYHAMIEESENDFASGKTTAHEDVVKYYKSK
jgi:hypothetical protein